MAESFQLNRRQFTSAGLAALGGAMGCLGGSVRAEPASDTPPPLPRVRWGNHEISRLLVGHNPIKGMSHFSAALSREMLEYFSDADMAHGRALLRRCEQFGINTCQMGGAVVESLLRAYYAEGGAMQWIATFYSAPGEGKAELERILKMDPKPIGAQHYGATTDQLMREGRLEKALDTIKMLKDAGLMVGLCSHNAEVIDYAESRGWEVDFYQGSFYHSTDGLRRDNPRDEVFDEQNRQSMVKVLSQVSKPCIAYKVLGANRHCGSPETVEAALRFALERLKPSDVVLLGMWQKHKDQVAENVALASRILATA